MSDAVRMESASPIFAVADLQRALAFYRDALGFEIAWIWGEPPHLAAVCRDRVQITLAQHAEDDIQGRSRLYLRVNGVDACYARLQRHDARIAVPIDDRVYGLRDFRVADPDGNELDIGEVIAEQRNEKSV